MSGIIRVKKNRDYFVASNEPFNDDNLTWEARGVMGYLLSKSDQWECRIEDLVNKGPAGKDKVERILNELMEHGYIRRHRQRREDGTFFWVTEVYESPTLNPDAQNEELQARLAIKRMNAIAKRQRAYEKQKAKQSSGVLSSSGLSSTGLSSNGESPPIINTESINTDSTNNTNADQAFAEICKAYEQEISALSPIIVDRIKESLAVYPAEWHKQAIGIAVEMNKRSWGYVAGILRNWKSIGGPQNDKPRSERKATNGHNPTHQKRQPQPRRANPTGPTDPGGQERLDRIAAKLEAQKRADNGG